MTNDDFYTTVLGMWGERWRPELKRLLAKHGMAYSRQTFWNWQHGKASVPDGVAFLLKKRKEQSSLS